MCRSGRKHKRSWLTPYSPVYVSVALAATIWLMVMPGIMQRFSIRVRGLTVKGGDLDTRTATDDFEANNENEIDSAPEPVSATASPAPLYPGAAIVALAGGDASGRNMVALLQSLRDVKTTLPIIILLARGGLGSAACNDHDWKKKVGRPDVQCSGPDTIGALGRVVRALMNRYHTCMPFLQPRRLSPPSLSRSSSASAPRCES